MTPPRPPKFEPSEELQLTDAMLKEYDIDNRDFPKFSIAIRILQNQMRGMSITAAAEDIGMSRYNLYEPQWIDLMAKARRFLAKPLLAAQASTANFVYGEWDAIVRSIVNVAKNGARDHEKVAAAELLYQIYIQPIQEAPRDDSKEVDYLRKPKNFNPMVPIQVLEGGTVIINNNGDTESGAEIVVHAKD